MTPPEHTQERPPSFAAFEALIEREPVVQTPEGEKDLVIDFLSYAVRNHLDRYLRSGIKAAMRHLRDDGKAEFKKWSDAYADLTRRNLAQSRRIAELEQTGDLLAAQLRENNIDPVVTPTSV